MSRVYLDWNATAPLRPEARAAMIAAMDVVGNPSSVHAEGRAAKGIVEKARSQVAVFIGCRPQDVIFTSGATEAAATVAHLQRFAGDVYCAEIEHDAVLEGQVWGERDLWPDLSGRLAIEAVFDTQILGALEGNELLHLQAANSETGVLQDVAAAFAHVRERAPKMTLVTDAVQAIGKLAFDFSATGADGVLVSAHKLGGPKGVGALIAANRLAARMDDDAFIRGGGQEMRRRSGTENVIGIAGFGAAAEAAARDLEAGVWDRVADLRNILEKTLEAAAKETIFVGKSAPRLPNTSCFATPGWKGETQVMQMDLAGFAISAGSACSSGKVRESRVLRAMGYDERVASSAVRVSLGPTNTEDEVLRFCEAWLDKYHKFRARAA